MPGEEKTTLRIPRDMYEEVVRISQREDRSINGQLVQLIRLGLQMAQTLPPRPPR